MHTAQVCRCSCATSQRQLEPLRQAPRRKCSAFSESASATTLILDFSKPADASKKHNRSAVFAFLGNALHLCINAAFGTELIINAHPCTEMNAHLRVEHAECARPQALGGVWGGGSSTQALSRPRFGPSKTCCDPRSALSSEPRAAFSRPPLVTPAF